MTLLENSSKYVSFSERDSVIDSIKWLSRHVPRCVIRDLCDDAFRHQRNEETKLTLPHAKTYSAALLFIDMSGFTKLSQMMDLESLSKVRNEAIDVMMKTRKLSLILSDLFSSASMHISRR